MQRLAILLVTAAWIVGGLSGCSEDKTGEQATDSVSQIQEEQLPPGQQVLELPVRPVRNLPENVTPLGSKDLKPASDETGTAGGSDKAFSLTKKYERLLMFHVRDTMEVKKPKLATLVLSRNSSVIELKEDVLESERPKLKEITTATDVEFGSKMKARLISFGDENDEESFKIEALGDDEQTFRENRKKLIWQWKVTPLKEGKHELKLSVQVLEKDGEATSLPAKNISVTIHATKRTTMQQIGGFLERKWEFVVTAILIPVIIAVVTSAIRNKGENKNKKAPH